jgi:hypothetical protein
VGRRKGREERRKEKKDSCLLLFLFIVDHISLREKSIRDHGVWGAEF